MVRVRVLHDATLIYSLQLIKCDKIFGWLQLQLQMMRAITF